MKKILLPLAFLAISTSLSQAAFISFSTGTARGHQFVLSDGATRVAVGSNVRVGYLTTPGDTSTFVEFGTTSIANPLSSQPIGGFLIDQTTNNPEVTGIRNQQVVVWVYGQGGQQGAFTSTAWTVPASLTPDVDASFDVVLGVNNGTPVQVTALPIENYTAASYTAPVSITVGTGTNPTGATYALGQLIPEPTSMGLLALAGLLVTRRRR
jgi:hypothetical protein